MADDDAPKKKGGKLKWIIIILLLLLLGGGGAAAWFFLFSDSAGDKDGSEKPKEVVKVSTSQNMQSTPLEPFLVNLADPLGKRYIKVTFEAEIVAPEIADELAKQKPKVRDSIITLLSSKTYADLASADSKEALKTEVVNRLNLILGSPKVTRVFIMDMVIQ